MNYQLNFKDNVVLITGGNGGIGKEIAKGFASLGATTILVGRNTEKLKSTEKEILDANGKCKIIQADLNIPEEIDTLISKIKKDFGRVDILINNAGIGHRIPSVDVTEKEWNSVLNINLTVPFILSSKIAKEFMIPQKSGKIINTASMGGFAGIPAAAAYSSSKGGILQLTRSLATEWAKYNIQVNAICPGYIATNLISAAMSNEQWMQIVKLRTPAGRVGKPEEVVGAALFLSSQMANYITGTYIQIDGGGYAAGF
ncbi:SDR family NAD(P)-dependent oxidoreductase [Eubacterium multiforme]|uniref:2-deoxy-D-gluconate 3-dehydrogenase n=1 Tax=Eubacterium multiforme TaxID=83339 RepID=A0ABT9USY5_9FIRM|nr:glucose 1-dehydrogenase [Eubacterium multiforme]MDQ0149417.1 2-deoxy-D-gluconate 3-dehydrogenase [Eubacterium multiforme]